MKTRRLRNVVALIAVGALTLSACTAVEPEAAPSPTQTEGGSDVVAEMVTGPGITADPCPDAVNADNGCIYLGVLSDLTEGPFAALAVPITDGQRAFWLDVNEKGGIGGFDVDIDANTRLPNTRPSTPRSLLTSPPLPSRWAQ